MGRAIKIGIIGAGSATFSLNIVRDLCLTSTLAGSHVCFMDVDQQRLDAVVRLANRYAQELGIDALRGVQVRPLSRCSGGNEGIRR